MKINRTFSSKSVKGSSINKINSKYRLKEETYKYTKRQKEFATPKPVRAYKRFINFRESLTGIDPYYRFIKFMNNEATKPIQRPTLYEQFNIKSSTYKNNNRCRTAKIKRAKWSLGTVARAPDEDKLPKKQQYKDYYFPPKYNNKEPEKYRNYFIKTDIIGIRIPKIDKVDPSKSFLKMKGGYYKNIETKTENRWKPYIGKTSNCNVSSKNYNIINFEPLNSRNTNCQILNKSLNHKSKGIAEYNELTYAYSKNFNKEYSKKYEENPKRFYKYNGPFTYMYDASNRNGKITLPFDLKQN